jgi:hypothetical protein
LGAETIIGAIQLYQRLNPARLDRTAGAWLDDAVAHTLTQHRVANMLGVSYYRLYRALVTGHTMRSPFDEVHPEQVSLGDLREDFANLVAGLPEDVAYAPEGRDNGKWVHVDPDVIETPREAVEREDEAERQARFYLNLLGIDNLVKNLGALDPDKLTGRELDDARNKVADTTARRSAATVERIAMNGGRTTVHTAIKHDKRAVGYMRVSTTGTPCGFCAMLISRPLEMAYSSERTGSGMTEKAKSVRDGRAVEGAEYHTNCHCIVIAVYSQEEYETSPQFEQNRKLDDMWQNADFDQKDDETFLQAWNRHFRNEQAKAKASR